MRFVILWGFSGAVVNALIKFTVDFYWSLCYNLGVNIYTVACLSLRKWRRRRDKSNIFANQVAFNHNLDFCRATKRKENMKISQKFSEQILQSKFPVVGAKVNNTYRNLNDEMSDNDVVELIDINCKEGMKIYRATLTYIMSKAFFETYRRARLTVDYQLSNAMYCTLDNMEVTDEMLSNVKSRMQEIIDQDLPIDKVVMTREEATEFFNNERTSKGRLQLDVVENETIKMYYCEDYYNYFYETIATHTGVTKIFDLIKYGKGFLLRYPSSDNVTVLPAFKETKKLQWALEEYETIYKILNVGTIHKLNTVIESGNVRQLILLSEALHEKKIANIADKIAGRKGVKMVLIAGPSSSGKTTFAQRLGIQLRLNGLKPVTISVDNYFVDRGQTPLNEKGEPDFECLEAIDTKLFNKQLLALLDGQEVEMPTFDFAQGKKIYDGTKTRLADDEILVIEGIHCLNDKLTSEIPMDRKYKVYISALTVLNIDAFNRISTTDTRFVRRIVRDHQFRAYSAQNTIKTWPNVNKGEEKNIFPFQEQADSIFNTSLIYELAVLKHKAMDLLSEITNDVPEYAEAKRLMDILKNFREIPEDLVPANSLVKEFLGGGDFKG